MELEINTDGRNVRCSVSGLLTYQDHNAYREFLQNCEDQKTNKITIELDHLTFIDSAGMGMFLSTIERCKAFHCEVIFKNANGQVLKMIELANITTVATIKKTIE